MDTSMDTELSKLRKRIDQLDASMAKLVEERVKVAEQIGALKQGNGKSVLDEKREQEVLERWNRWMREVIEKCKMVQ